MEMTRLVERIAELSEQIGAWEYQEETLLTEIYDHDECEKCKNDCKQAREEREWLMEIIENDEEFRVCDDCKCIMQEGYCIDGGYAYYCSEDCLHKHYTEEEWEELYDNGNSESYWTEWY